MAALHTLLLEAAGQNARLNDWCMGGKWIVYQNSQDGFGDLLLLPAEGDHKPVTYLPKATFRRFNARFWPDGLWDGVSIGRVGPERSVLSGCSCSSEKVTISSGGGFFPRWRRDGKEFQFDVLLARLRARTRDGCVDPLLICGDLALNPQPI